MTLRHHLLAARFDLYCRHLSASRKPILVGPFRSEVGFEALYWLPFLASLVKRWGWDPARLIACSRGGAACWYGAGATAELYDHVSPDDVRLFTLAAQQRQQSTKQIGIEPWERHVVGLVAASLGYEPGQVHLLHPSWMYCLFAPWWADQAAPGVLARYSRLTRLAPPPLPENVKLPPSFVAVRFYSRPTWPSTEATLFCMREIVTKLAVKQPVVLLNSGLRLDDHADLVAADGQRVHDLTPVLTPRNNLAIISAVLARAKGFVGTYGGLAQLALRLGVPTVAYYQDWHSTALAHLDLTHRIAVSSGVPFMLVRPSDVEHWRAVL